MAKKRFCNVEECKETIDVPLTDFGDKDWMAFQIPEGSGAIVCFCPKHYLQGREYMEDCLREQKPTKLKQEGGNSSQP